MATKMTAWAAEKWGYLWIEAEGRRYDDQFYVWKRHENNFRRYEINYFCSIQYNFKIFIKYHMNSLSNTIGTCRSHKWIYPKDAFSERKHFIYFDPDSYIDGSAQWNYCSHAFNHRYCERYEYWQMHEPDKVHPGYNRDNVLTSIAK